jgi:hypothetical protein
MYLRLEGLTVLKAWLNSSVLLRSVLLQAASSIILVTAYITTYKKSQPRPQSVTAPQVSILDSSEKQRQEKNAWIDIDQGNGTKMQCSNGNRLHVSLRESTRLHMRGMYQIKTKECCWRCVF